MVNSGYAAMPFGLVVAWAAAQTPGAGSRHSGTTGTRSYDMVAAFTLP
jgi:hypothetical protein